MFADRLKYVQISARRQIYESKQNNIATLVILEKKTQESHASLRKKLKPERDGIHLNKSTE